MNMHFRIFERINWILCLKKWPINKIVLLQNKFSSLDVEMTLYCLYIYTVKASCSKKVFGRNKHISLLTKEHCIMSRQLQ